MVAFSSWVFNGEQSRSNYTAPRLFDWNKITTYAPFDNLDTRGDWPDNGTLYSDLICKAHQYVKGFHFVVFIVIFFVPFLLLLYFLFVFCLLPTTFCYSFANLHTRLSRSHTRALVMLRIAYVKPLCPTQAWCPNSQLGLQKLDGGLMPSDTVRVRIPYAQSGLTAQLL